jgi:hypothetical protein
VSAPERQSPGTAWHRHAVVQGSPNNCMLWTLHHADNKHSTCCCARKP